MDDTAYLTETPQGGYCIYSRIRMLDQEYQQVQNQTILQQINKPDTTALYERTEALAKELAEYKGKYAEYFI